MESEYKVKTSIFEGPLEVLLDLIEKRKLFINDISLAKVADDYISYVKTLERFPIAQSANFILVASTLLLIKSKSLLPTLSLSEDEKGDIADLERRLKIYKKIKELSIRVKEHFGKKIMFAPEIRQVEPVFSPSKEMTVGKILIAVKEVLKNLPKKDFLSRVVVEKVISLENMISRLTERVNVALKMSFREFSKSHKDGANGKIHIIVSFLAMLELVKQGIISVTQERAGGDIIMETEKISTPRYG